MRTNPVKRFSPPDRHFSRFPHFPPQRPEDFYRYDPHVYEEYYREYFARYNNNPHGVVGAYPAPVNISVAATTAVPPYDNRSYYDPRARPMPPSNTAVSAPAANSPSNRSRKGPMGRSSPLPRRERPREKLDAKTTKLTEPLPQKVKEKKVKVKSEEDLRKKMERKREEKLEKSSKDKTKELSRESSGQPKRSSKSSEKSSKESKKKSESKKHRSGEKSSRSSASDFVGPKDIAKNESSQNKDVSTDNVSNLHKRSLETTSSTNIEVTSNKVNRTVSTSEPKALGHSTAAAAELKTSSRTVVTKVKRKANYPSADSSSQKVTLPSLDTSDKCVPVKKSRRESVHEKMAVEGESNKPKISEKIPPRRMENDLLLPAPELSKWERDDYEVNIEPMKPKKKPTERKPLPRSVIESAEKAITEKRRKPSMVSTSIANSPKSSLSSRKVYVDEKDTRKLSSVQITISSGERNETNSSSEKPSRPQASEKRSRHSDSSREQHSSREPGAKEVVSGASSHKMQESSKSKQVDVGRKDIRGNERFERKESMVDEAKFVPDYEESDSGSDANLSDPAHSLTRKAVVANPSSEEEAGKKRKKSKDSSSKKKKHKKHKKHKVKKSKKKKSQKHRSSKEKNVRGQSKAGHENKELAATKEHDSKVRSRISRY